MNANCNDVIVILICNTIANIQYTLQVIVMVYIRLKSQHIHNNITMAMRYPAACWCQVLIGYYVTATY